MLHEFAQHTVPVTRTFAAERELKDAGVWKPGEGSIITITDSETIIFNPSWWFQIFEMFSPLDSLWGRFPI